MGVQQPQGNNMEVSISRKECTGEMNKGNYDHKTSCVGDKARMEDKQRLCGNMHYYIIPIALGARYLHYRMEFWHH